MPLGLERSTVLYVLRGVLEDGKKEEEEES